MEGPFAAYASYSELLVDAQQQHQQQQQHSMAAGGTTPCLAPAALLQMVATPPDSPLFAASRRQHSRLDSATLALVCETLERRCAANSTSYAISAASDPAAAASGRPGGAVFNPPTAEAAAVLVDATNPNISFAAMPPAEPVTYFHSIHVCTVSLFRYVQFAASSVPGLSERGTLYAALVLFDRFEATTRLPVTTAMMHRLLVACLLVASKALSDSHAANDIMSQRLQLPLAELNRLEVQLLLGTAWRVTVQRDEIEAIIHWVKPAPMARGAVSAQGSTTTVLSHDPAALSLSGDCRSLALSTVSSETDEAITPAALSQNSALGLLPCESAAEAAARRRLSDGSSTYPAAAGSDHRHTQYFASSASCVSPDASHRSTAPDGATV